MPCIVAPTGVNSPIRAMMSGSWSAGTISPPSSSCGKNSPSASAVAVLALGANAAIATPMA